MRVLVGGSCRALLRVVFLETWGKAFGLTLTFVVPSSRPIARSMWNGEPFSSRQRYCGFPSDLRRDDANADRIIGSDVDDIFANVLCETFA